MWFDGVRQPNTIYVANVSRGKDSTAMLRAIRLMGWPLDAIVSVDIWATQDIPAELPPMVEFKDEWDRKCLENFGVPVTRLCATKRERERETCRVTLENATHENGAMNPNFTIDLNPENSWEQSRDFQNSREAGAKSSSTSKLTYEDIFYRKVSPQRERERERERERMAARQKPECKHTDDWISDATWSMVQQRPQKVSNYGFPITTKSGGNWCTALKRDAIKSKNLDIPFSDQRPDKAQKINIVHYLGIAADEPVRIKRHISKADKVLPLVQIGWDEALCGLEATYLDMLSPTYTTSMRDGCWFCHNQGVDQLRNLRKSYPDLWALLLKWDNDSPVTFHADGHTVHDFDKRFALEDEGIIDPNEKFRWSMLENQQLRLF